MHFYTLFYQHVFLQIFLNNNFQFLNTCIKRTLNLSLSLMRVLSPPPFAAYCDHHLAGELFLTTKLLACPILESVTSAVVVLRQKTSKVKGQGI